MSSELATAGRWSVRAGWRETLIAASSLALLLVMVHGDVVFGGRTLVLSNHMNPLDYRYLEQNYGPELVPPSVWQEHGLLPYANLHDPEATWWQWEPANEFLRQGLWQGEFPWWDPYSGMGTPGMANLVQACLFPPSLGMVLVGGTAGLKDLYTLFWMLSSGLCTYLFLRRNTLAPVAAFFAATAFLLSGSVQQHASSFLGQTIACLPVALLLSRWFLDSPSWRRSALLAVSYGALSLASFPPLLLAVFGISAIYSVLAALGGATPPSGPGRGTVLLRFVFASLLALGLVAFYYLPAFAAAEGAPQVEDAYRQAGLETIPPGFFLDLLSPTLSAGDKIYSDPPVSRPERTILPYLGTVPLVMAFLAGGGGPARRRTLLGAAFLVGVLVAMKLVGLAPVQWLGHAPGLGSVHFSSYFGNLLVFVLAVLAGLGLDTLLRGQVSARRFGVMAAVMVVSLASLWSVGLEAGVADHPQGREWVYRWLVVAGLVVAAIAVAAGAMLARRAFRHSRLALALLALLAAQGQFFNLYPRPARWDVWRHPPPFVEELSRRLQDGRMLAFGAPHPSTGMAFGLRAMSSLMPFNPGRSFEFYRYYLEPDARLFMGAPSRLPPEPVLDVAAVHLLAIREAFQTVMMTAQARPYQEVYGDGYVRVFERQAPPRCYFTSTYRVMPRQAVLEALAEHRSDSVVLLEERPSFPSRRRPPGGALVSMEHDGRNRVVLSVDAPTTGLVYCADSFASGWTAKVDGEEVPILPANYAFRAVEVPSGVSTLRFEYRPPGLLTGLAVSGVSLVVVGSLIVAPVRRHPGFRVRG